MNQSSSVQIQSLKAKNSSQQNNRWHRLTRARIWWWAAAPGDSDRSFWVDLKKKKKPYKLLVNITMLYKAHLHLASLWTTARLWCLKPPLHRRREKTYSHLHHLNRRYPLLLHRWSLSLKKHTSCFSIMQQRRQQERQQYCTGLSKTDYQILKVTIRSDTHWLQYRHCLCLIQLSHSCPSAHNPSPHYTWTRRRSWHAEFQGLVKFPFPQHWSIKQLS